mmetsp:Transcript_148231/g.369552  ORF Transcript_148231/g.369552 Transcript_148231/m.369552 type:complete len:345 (-) Transcript_148231:510-1544(-)
MQGGPQGIVEVLRPPRGHAAAALGRRRLLPGPGEEGLKEARVLDAPSSQPVLWAPVVLVILAALVRMWRVVLGVALLDGDVDVGLQADLDVLHAGPEICDEQLGRFRREGFPLHEVSGDQRKCRRQYERVVEDAHAIAELLASFAKGALMADSAAFAAPRQSRVFVVEVVVKARTDPPILHLTLPVAPHALLPHDLAARPQAPVMRGPGVPAIHATKGREHLAHVCAVELILLQWLIADLAEFLLVHPSVVHPREAVALRTVRAVVAHARPGSGTRTAGASGAGELRTLGAVGALLLELRELFEGEASGVGLQGLLPLGPILQQRVFHDLRLALHVLYEGRVVG